jgi:hypothetical protein
LFYIAPVLSYFSGNLASSELGAGWSHIFKRQVQVGTHVLTVVTGADQPFSYQRAQLGGFNPPTSNTLNSLQTP